MINQLVSKIQKTGAPIVVGLDPMMKFVPEHIQKKAFSEYGETLEGAAEAIWQYNKGIVDAVYDLIPAVKPQIAMYEQFGIPGLQAFKKTVDYCKEKGLVVIGDIKRGDIGSTSTAYAVGHLGKVQVGSNQFSGFDEDFVQKLGKRFNQLSEKAAEIAKEFFKNRCENKPDNYANARDVRNYLEKAVSNQASRIVSLKDVNNDTLAVLEKEDVENISLG